MSARGLQQLQTARMVGDRLRPEHAGEWVTLLLDPRITATLWPGRPPTETELQAGLFEKLEHWHRHGFGMWLLRDRGTGAMVGRGGLQHTQVVGADEVEIGWVIVPERWGEGLATELALASVEVAFGELGLEDVIAYTLLTNIASRRVMEKAGLTYEREFEHASLPHVLYRRKRPA